VRSSYTPVPPVSVKLPLQRTSSVEIFSAMAVQVKVILSLLGSGTGSGVGVGPPWSWQTVSVVRPASLNVPGGPSGVASNSSGCIRVEAGDRLPGRRVL
jgi:hypothetical protein